MSIYKPETRLIRLLRQRLSDEDRALLRSAFVDRSDVDYGPAFEAARRAAPRLRDQVERNRCRIRRHFTEIADLPPARIRTLIRNSPPAMLATLAWTLIRRSYAKRTRSPGASLSDAQLGLEAALELRGQGYFDRENQADLEGEAWIYLANARRITSDLPGAEVGFLEASRNIREGTGDRGLKATFLHELAALRFRQGRIDEALELYDREIQLRRLLGVRGELGTALVGRGIVCAWSTRDLQEALDTFEEAAHLIEDDDHQLLILQAIAERLARDGDGLLAWKAICSAETGVALVQTTAHDLRLRWIKGITYRVLGELERAARELVAVRQAFVASGEQFQAALSSLDLAAVRASQGKTREVQALAEEAYTIFQAIGLPDRALAALLVFRRAAATETATEQLAVQVANWVSRRHMDNAATFEETAPG